jgi:hypothetical protein
VDQVHGVGARVHGTSLNVSHSFGNLRPGLNEPKGYPNLLILVVDAGMDDPWWLHRQGWRDCGGTPGLRRRLPGVGCYRRSGPLNMRRSSITASGRRGELTLLTLGWQRATVVASDSGTPCSSPWVNVQWLQGFSRLQNRWAAVVTAPWTRGVFQLQRESSSRSRRVSDFVVKNSGSTADYL